MLNQIYLLNLLSTVQPGSFSYVYMFLKIHIFLCFLTNELQLLRENRRACAKMLIFNIPANISVSPLQLGTASININKLLSY